MEKHLKAIRNNIRGKLFKNRLFHKEVAFSFSLKHFKNPDKNKIAKLKNMVKDGHNVEHLITALNPRINKMVQTFYKYEGEIDEITSFYGKARELFPKYERLIHYKVEKYLRTNKDKFKVRGYLEARYFEHEDLFQDMYMVYLKTVASYNDKCRFSTQLGRNIDFELSNKYRKKKREFNSCFVPIDTEDGCFFVSYSCDPYPIKKDFMRIVKSVKGFGALHCILAEEILVNEKNIREIHEEYGLTINVISQYKKDIIIKLRQNDAIKELLNKT